jgi:hypothetical protein
VHFLKRAYRNIVTLVNMSAFSNDTKTTNLYMRTSGMYIFSQSINWTDPFYAEKGYLEEQTMETISNESKNLWEFLYIAGFDNHFYGYPEIRYWVCDIKFRLS